MWTRSPEVVGRDSEVRRLDAAVRDAVSMRGTAVFLVGEAGVGKSRLAAETVGRAVAADMEVLRGRSSTFGPSVPFRPLTEALLSLFRGGRSPDVDELGPYLPVLGRLVPDWHRGESSDLGRSLLVLGEAVLRLLSIVSRDRGCLLVLEDLQDADAETLSVVEYLVDNLSSERILLVGTIRAEPCGALDLARAAARRDSCVLLELDRLDHDSVCQLVGNCLEVEPGQVPAQATDMLWANSAGNPFVVEELLYEMVNDGALVRGRQGWQVAGELRAAVPAAVVTSVAQRADRLGPEGRLLLSTAAVLGQKFPLSVVQAITGITDRSLLSHLNAGLTAQLIAPDETGRDWYSFRHPLTAEALLAQLNPTTHADLARRAADTVEELHPGLPGTWCHLVASLRLAADDKGNAGRLLAEAGRRALADGAADSAVTMLWQAEELLVDLPDTAAHTDVLETLLYALAETGQFERAYQLASAHDEFDNVERGVALHARLAWAAYLASRLTDGLNHVRAARKMLGPDAPGSRTAQVDAVEAHLVLVMPGPDRLSAAERLATRALEVAEREPLPAVACQALQALGVAARERDLPGSGDYFVRSLALAEQHRLPYWRIHALFRLGGTDWLSTADNTYLLRAGREARRTGAVALSYAVDAISALDLVFRGDYEGAEKLIDEHYDAVVRLQMADIARYLLMTRAVLAAHQCRRRDMESALAELRRVGGVASQEHTPAVGLAEAFCALLEEDGDRARRELSTDAIRLAEQTRFHLAGKHGLGLLLDVLEGDADWAAYQEVSSTAVGRMRWNRQFLLLAGAVLAGRAGRTGEAEEAMAAALAEAAPFPMASHLVLRLGGDAAATDGWGDPVTWLRTAEDYFQRASMSAIASSCRARLRQLGVVVQNRQQGSDQVPDSLQALGVTVREYEVLLLVAERLGNKEIAARLHISPRTVEKHVASLLTKTKQPLRSALHDYRTTFRITPG